MTAAVTVLPLDSPAFPPNLKEAATALASNALGNLGYDITDVEVRCRLFGPSLRPGQVLVALLDGQIAGMASFKCRGPGPVSPGLTDFVSTLGIAGLRYWGLFVCIQMLISGEGVFIVGIDVFEGFQKRGVGGALMDELHRVARAHDVDRITTDVRADNKSAHEFYRRAGFVPENRSVFSFGWLARKAYGYTRVRCALTPARESSNRYAQLSG